MTREEAIKILKAIRVYECYPKSASEETKEAIDMAIETLSAAAVTHGRLIDADRLKSYIDCGHLRPPTEVCFSELDVCNMIDKAPTVSAEAVEVVRCKDCKNWYGWEHGTGSCHRSENGYNWFGVDATDYCSFGERKGGDSE